MARKLFADLPTSDEVVPVGGSSALPRSSRRNGGLWPVGTFFDKIDNIKEAIMDSDGYIRTVELTNSISPYFKKAYSFASSAAWILSTSFIVIGLPLVFEMDRELNEAGAGMTPANAPTAADHGLHPAGR
mmetsp:Transcript_6577/g.11897  ORF Transcript_6577/g.11897 Transcript_6577/m.11897 type:complete len:130 (-) Transcript_6577:92-481(-)